MSVKNVIIILCDQLRKDTLGCYGNKHINTPNIDELAKTGRKFERNYAANPICSPNRLSIFSGMYTRNHGLWTNGLLLKDDGYTLMHNLKNAGVQTANIGKIHFEPNNCDVKFESRENENYWKKNPDMKDWHGPFWGFDYIELQNSCGGLHSQHMTQWFYENGGNDEMAKVYEEDGIEFQKIPNKLHRSSFVGDRSVNYLKNIRDKEKPFFLSVSFTDPHHPFIATQQSLEKLKSSSEYNKPIGSNNDLDTYPEHYSTHYQNLWHRKGIINNNGIIGYSEIEERNRIINSYAMVELIDENIGKIVLELKKQGIEDETAIIFTSDHGELLGDHGLWHKGPFFFEGLVNTPLIVKTPENKSGVDENSLVSSVDLAPSIAEMFGLTIPFYMDGVSQLEVFLGKSTSKRDCCLLEYRNGYGKSIDVSSKMLVTNEYKYVCYENGDEELKNLKEDPFELENLANNEDHHIEKNNMRWALLKYILKTESNKPEQISNA